MGKFKNYTFKNVNVIFGLIELEGFGEGDDVVRIEMDTEQFRKLVGAKGDVTRSQTNDNSCTITIKLLQTSLSNKELMIAYLLDRETGAATVPMIVNDKEEGETYIINNSWIQRTPSIVRGNSPNNMEWVFQGDFMTPAFV